MKYLAGTDIVKIERMKSFLGKSAVDSVFTKKEKEYILGKKNPEETAAGIFAAKEAIFKALGKSIYKRMTLAEVNYDENGKPYFKLDEEFFGKVSSSLSVSHDGDYAIAFVIATHETIEKTSIEKEVMDFNTYLVKSANIRKRENDTNKGNYGHVLALCGSKGMSGAALMAGKSMSKSGAGLITMGVPAPIGDIIAKKLPEAMLLYLKDNGQSFTKYAIDEIDEISKKANTLLIGPGMRNNEDTAYLIKEAIKKFRGKNIVIDADGLNALSDSPEYFENAVITPHPGEMARLIDTDVASVQRDRKGVATSFAKKYNCTVILKGFGTIVATSDGKAYLVDKGNPGMSNGGSGDCLAGIVASFMAQGIPDAPIKAAYVHSLAGDMCKEKYSENAFSATDLIKMIPKAIKSMYD